MNTQELLAAALDELQLNGWCQETMEREDGKHCVLGALRCVIRPSILNEGLSSKVNGVSISVAYINAINALTAALPAHYYPDLTQEGRILRWNDELDRTEGKIFDWFIRAKKYA